MKKKICLIIPPSPFLLDEKVFPFLGILKVAAAWEKQGEIIDIIDLGGIQNYLDIIEEYVRNNKDLEFIGITFTSPQAPNAYKIGQLIKNLQPNIKLVAGGSHTTLMNTASKNEVKNGVVSGRAFKDVQKLKNIFNILVCGDGELTLNEIRNIENGVIDVDDKTSPLFLTNQSFSDLPNPARHLIDLSSYHYTVDGKKATSLISQLGCPFRCSFCSGRSSPYLRKIRNRSWQSVVHEIEQLHLLYGYEGWMFYDDELNVNKEMVQLMNGLADLSQKYGKSWSLRGFTKAELFTEEQAQSMVRAGFKILLTGFESGDERILTNIQKQATRDDNTRCVEIAKKYGLKVKALMSLGHAGESFETIENTKKWLLEVQPEDFDATNIVAYPGSPYFDFAVKTDDFYTFTSKQTGDKLYQKELDYTYQVDNYKGVPGEYVSYVWTDYLSPEDLVKARDDLESEVRRKLNIPFNPSNPSIKYEHSMSQGNILPDWILRSTETHKQQYFEPKQEKKKLTVVQ